MHRRQALACSAAALALAAALACDPSEAATTSATLTVTARVGGNCRFNPPSTTSFTLAFNTYTPSAGNLNVSTNLQVRCTSGVPFQIALGGGGSGNVANRRMSATGAPAETLAYQLYTDAAYTTIWGDGSSGTAVRSSVGTPGPQTFTIYGRIPDSGTNLAAAPRTDYRDVVTITVTY
jgi:spore coat protein U-like protein